MLCKHYIDDNQYGLFGPGRYHRKTNFEVVCSADRRIVVKLQNDSYFLKITTLIVI
jgi:hypothetical protein